MTIPALAESRFRHEGHRDRDRLLRNRKNAQQSCYHSPSARVNANRPALKIMVHKSSRVLHVSTAALVAPGKSTLAHVCGQFDLDQFIRSLVENLFVSDAHSASA